MSDLDPLMTHSRATTIFCADYEHCQGISGTFDDVIVTWEPKSTKFTFPLALNRKPFEVSEFSLSNYIMLRDRGADWLVALPIFPYRRFRQGNAYVSRQSKLRHPSELKGRKIGVPDFSMTAAVWSRGIFRLQYGLDWREIHWVSGTKQRFPAPSEVSLTKTEGNLEELLDGGAIDSLWTPDLSNDAVLSGKFRPLLDNHIAEEQAFYGKTGVYPPNHVMVINRDVVRDPEKTAVAIFKAFVRSKWQAYERRFGTTLIPWGESRWNEAMKVFGGNPLPYGPSAPNLASVDMLAGFLEEQGLVRRRLSWSELFVNVEYPADARP